MNSRQFENYVAQLNNSGWNNRYKWGTCKFCGNDLLDAGKIVYAGQCNHFVIHEHCADIVGKQWVELKNTDKGDKVEITFVINGNTDDFEKINTILGVFADSKRFKNLLGDYATAEMPKQKSLSSVSKWFDDLENNGIEFTYILKVWGKEMDIDTACPRRFHK